MKRLTLCVAILGIAGCGSDAIKQKTDVHNANTEEKDTGSVKTEAELDKAIADYTEAIRVKPEDAMTYVLRGFAYAYKHEFDTAIADYSEAIRLDPAHAVAYYNRGLAYKALGDKMKADADLAKGRELGFKD